MADELKSKIYYDKFLANICENEFIDIYIVNIKNELKKPSNQFIKFDVKYFLSLFNFINHV